MTSCAVSVHFYMHAVCWYHKLHNNVLGPLPTSSTIFDNPSLLPGNEVSNEYVCWLCNRANAIMNYSLKASVFLFQRNNKTLKMLSLSGCGLNTVVATYIFTSLKNSTSLKELDLSEN